jgi:hypothetical protein
MLVEPIHVVAEATIETPHINRMLAESIHVAAEATIDMAPYQSHARRAHSRGRRSHD